MINFLLYLFLLIPNIPAPTVDHIEVGEWQYCEWSEEPYNDFYYDDIIITEDKQYYEITDSLLFYIRFNFINNKAICTESLFNDQIYMYRCNSRSIWGIKIYQGLIIYFEINKK